MIIIKTTNSNGELYFIKSDNVINKHIHFNTFIKFNMEQLKDQVIIKDIELVKQNTFHLLDKSNFKDFLENQDIYLVNSNQLIKKYLALNGFNYSQVDVCYKCLNKNIITILNKKSSYIYNNKSICKSCCIYEIECALEDNSYHNSSLYRFKNLLNRTNDTSQIFNYISNTYDLTSSDSLTLYDTIEANNSDYEQVHIDEVDIPDKFRDILKDKISYLLPVQIRALNNGLLFDKNLLVVSATASGKTLIGELAGISKTLEKKKFVYLVPLVALANQKYRYFKESYSRLGLKVVIKVGSNRIHAPDELVIVEENVEDADIIVATYEGLDYILRKGEYKSLNELGVVVIDEIHMLDTKERGVRLNALIGRLESIFSETQIIGLSATIKNPEQLSEEFNMDLVEYDKRPVKLERHIMYADDEKHKMDIITTLCKSEYNTTSQLGFKGQSIIFTDSRRKTEIISKKLNANGINAASYHAGLTYAKKIEIELEYANQNISTIVTTAALAAGVDFPASQVIFESLRMGKDWLTNNEFHQMLGRAGRPTYQENGKIVIIPQLKKQFDYVYEETMALKLLNSDVDDIHVSYSPDEIYEQVLSDISAIENVDIELLESKYNNYDTEILFNQALTKLLDNDMLEYDSLNDKYNVTDYGRAVSMSFISIDIAEYIRNNITNDLIDLITSIEYMSNVYLGVKYLTSLNRILNTFVSTRLFADSTKELITDAYILDRLPNNLSNNLISLIEDFGDPTLFDGDFERNISKHIIERRLNGWNPKEISNEFKRYYDLYLYSGDIFNYLDQIIRILEAIKRISESFEIYSVYESVDDLIKKIEGC